MNLNELENDLREYREGSQKKINTDKLWGRVSPHIPQSKKNNYSSFLFFLFPFLLLIGSIFWLVSGDTMALKESTIASEQNKAKEQESEIELVKNSIAVSNVSESATVVQSVNQQNSFESISNSYIESSTIANVLDHKNEETLIHEYNVDSHNPKKLTDEFQFYSNNAAKFNPASELNNKSKAILSALTERTESLNNSSYSEYIFDDSFNSIEHSKTTIGGGSEGFDLSKADIELNDNSLNALADKNNRALFDFTLLPLNSQLIFDGDLPLPPKRLYQLRNKSYEKVSVEMGGGYFFISRSLSLNNPEFANAFTSRSDAEELLEAWQTSLAIRYMVNPNVGISVGANYLVINERSTKSISQTEPLFVQDVVIGNFVRLDGSVEPILGDVEINRTIQRNVSRVNAFKLIQVPIEVFYTNNINQLKYEVGVGIISNISSSATGFWHPDNESEYDLSIDENNYLSSRIDVSFTGRAGIAYPLSNSLDIYSNVRYIASLNGFENENYSINQSYSLFGLELGLRINLFK